MERTPHGYTIEQLADRVGVPVRTVRYYIAEGLLPGPGSRGKAAAYAGEHLDRLRLIRRLTERHVPLAEVRAALADLALDEVRALLAEEDRRAGERQSAARAQSPRAYLGALLEGARAQRASAPGPPVSPAPRATPTPERPVPQTMIAPPLAMVAGPLSPAAASAAWRRYTLAPGVELHVREDVAASQTAVIERLLRVARELLANHGAPPA